MPVEPRVVGHAALVHVERLGLARALAVVVGPLARFGRDDGVTTRRTTTRSMSSLERARRRVAEKADGGATAPGRRWVTNDTTTSARGSNVAGSARDAAPTSSSREGRRRGHPSFCLESVGRACERRGSNARDKRADGALPRDLSASLDQVRLGAFQNEVSHRGFPRARGRRARGRRPGKRWRRTSRASSSSRRWRRCARRDRRRTRQGRRRRRRARQKPREAGRKGEEPRGFRRWRRGGTATKKKASGGSDVAKKKQSKQDKRDEQQQPPPQQQQQTAVRDPPVNRKILEGKFDALVFDDSSKGTDVFAMDAPHVPATATTLEDRLFFERKGHACIRNVLTRDEARSMAVALIERPEPEPYSRISTACRCCARPARWTLTPLKRGGGHGGHREVLRRGGWVFADV